MKKILKITGWLLLIALIIIQFFRPSKNEDTSPAANHISLVYQIPAQVKSIMEKACYDCHSNHTRYPWYFNVQPVGMWMNNHIVEGKRELNFSEYANKSLRYQYHKLEETIEQVKEGEMPINSYTWTHREARLSGEEKTALMDWARSVMDTLKARYPMDSLVRRRPS